MNGFPGSPHMLHGGLVQLDPLLRSVLAVIGFQYNPDSVTRTLQPRAAAAEPGDRLEVLRLTGPPHETIKLDAELDATERLEKPDDQSNAPVVSQGLLPVLAALESLITPPAAEFVDVDNLFGQGRLEVAPAESPLTVLVWGVKRVVPVRVTSMSLTEEAFDPHLHPIRAKASLELRVLTTSDLPITHLGASLFLRYRQSAEQLAGMVASRDVRPLGLEHLP
jgi:hypothetical protein